MLGVMEVLTQDGDLKQMWDSAIATEVEQARRLFADMRAKGYFAYKVDAKGDKAEVLNEFDPHVEKMILAPQLRGG